MEKERFEDLISQVLKKLPYRFLNKLKNIAEKFISISDNIQMSDMQMITFPNIISACSVLSYKQPYCSDENKLLISVDDFNKFLDIFANEITDPVRARRIFYIENYIINPLLFEKHKDEKIIITVA